MKTESDKQKFSLFIGCLIGIALLVNFFFIEIAHSYRNDKDQRRQQQEQAQQQQELKKQQEADAVQAEKNAEAEHARYLARYLDSGFVRKSDVKTIAIIAASEDGKWDSDVGDALAGHLKASGVEMLPSFFKAEFISDGLFNDAFGGLDDLSQKLELGKFIDGVVLAREQVSYSQNPSLENVTSADMRLEISVMPVSASVQNQTWTLTATGTGFKNEDARAMAEERLIKQIATDANVKLN
jgi:hypothetical protein